MTGAKLDTCCLDNQHPQVVDHQGEDCHGEKREERDKKSNNTDCNLDCCHSLLSPFNHYQVKDFHYSFEYKYVSNIVRQTNQYHPKLYRPPIS